MTANNSLHRSTCQKSASTLGAAGIDLEDTDLDLDIVAKVFRPTFMPSQKEQILSVWRKGKPVHYMVRDRALYNALMAIEPEPVGLAIKILSYPNQLLKAGITLDPTFLPKGPIRSVPTAMMQAKGYNAATAWMFPFHLMGNMFHTLGKTDKYYEWLSSGGAQSTMHSIEENYMKKSLNKLNHRSIQQVMKREMKTLGVGAVLKALRTLQEKLDEPVRMTEYQQVLKKTGGDRVKAAAASRDVDLDFARSGSKTRPLNAMNLFFNVALQGPEKAVRTFKERPFDTTLKASLYITIPR